MLKSLNDSEAARVADILHHQPTDCFFVLAVHARGFNHLCLQAGNAVGLGVAMEVGGKCVDHFDCLYVVICLGETGDWKDISTIVTAAEEWVDKWGTGLIFGISRGMIDFRWLPDGSLEGICQINHLLVINRQFGNIHEVGAECCKIN